MRSLRQLLQHLDPTMHVVKVHLNKTAIDANSTTRPFMQTCISIVHYVHKLSLVEKGGRLGILPPASYEDPLRTHQCWHLSASLEHRSPRLGA